MRSKCYRVENLAGQKIILTITTLSGELVEDVLEENEVVYGLNENAAKQLALYENWGMVRITETTGEEPKVRWLVEGF